MVDADWQIELMKDRKGKSRIPIMAAGGIVLRNDPGTPRLAVVQSRKLETWGLPKGKLAAGEDAMTAARREVLEETGHHVTVHEFLGTLVYETGSRSKVVQFWRMEAADAPAGVLMHDVKAVDWLSLEEAIDTLSHLRERVFLEQVGPIALRLAARRAGNVPGVPLALAALPNDKEQIMVAAKAASFGPEPDGPKEPGHAGPIQVAPQLWDTGSAAPAKYFAQKSLTEKNLMKKIQGWFRRGALLRRQPIE